MKFLVAFSKTRTLVLDYCPFSKTVRTVLQRGTWSFRFLFDTCYKHNNCKGYIKPLAVTKISIITYHYFEVFTLIVHLLR